MSSRYLLTAPLSEIESKFALPPQSITIEPNYNIFPGQYVPVITTEKPYEIQLLKFGLTPFWARAEMNHFNARAEGDSNKTDDPTFHGSTGIILKPAFRKPIRSQRCIVLASAFIVFPAGNIFSNPHLVYLINHQNPFAFAGIWDTWYNPVLLETITSFSIITTTANKLLRQIGTTRMPVILTYSEAKKWINSTTELTHITHMLNHYDSKLMNAYPIHPAITQSTANDKQLVMPVGPHLTPDPAPVPIIKTHGYYGHTKKKQNSDTPKPTMAERFEASNKPLS